MRDDEIVGASSPTASCSSADEALYEMLGLDKLSLDQESHTFNKEKPTILISPPTCCHRPQTPHDAILLLCPAALSSWQCQYIIRKGQQATNDGGAHYGPHYVKQAVHASSTRVKLERPNHHKVCVFMDTMILTWITNTMRNLFDEYIQDWNGCINNDKYIVNPRLRLLRYDAVDKDVFLNHYDATTTTTREGVEYESKLTILIYLNTDFVGGKTAFLNSLNPSDFCNIEPKTGQVVVFNHELYHSSRTLEYEDSISIDSVQGGTKFVLRSDVMFEKQVQAVELCTSTCILDMPTNEAIQLKVVDILSDCRDTNHLAAVLDQLDLLNTSIRSFLVPGRVNLIDMLMDLGVKQVECDEFIDRCEAVLLE